MQLHSHVSEVVSIFPIRQNNGRINGKIMAKTAFYFLPMMAKLTLPLFFTHDGKIDTALE